MTKRTVDTDGRYALSHLALALGDVYESSVKNREQYWYQNSNYLIMKCNNFLK